MTQLLEDRAIKESTRRDPECCGDRKKLVRWNVNFLKPGHERAYPPRDTLVSGSTTMQELKNQVLVEFAREHRIPASEARYIRVFAHVLRWFEEPAWDFEEKQIEVLEKISRKLGPDRGHHKVKLPKTGVLTGVIDSKVSDFGDEFVGFPPEFGERPAPGQTMLSGWVRITFDEPQGNVADFVLEYFGVGTPVRIEWGGGQVFEFFRTRTFPTPFLNGVDTVNRGKLDLDTGKVTDLSLNATFQGTTIGRTDKVNRIPYAFPYIYPPLPLPEGFQPPPEYQPPIPPPKVFADFEFQLAPDGEIVGFSLESETFAPTGLFPFLPPMPEGFFPPFSWGRDFTFHFANPDYCLKGTPSGNCPNDLSNPDGVLRAPESYSVYFHPHLNLITSSLGAAEPERGVPPCTPDALANSVVVEAEGRVYQIGGLGAKGVSGHVHCYDPEAGKWSEAPSLPTPVAGAQGAAHDGRIYVFGGWSDAGKEITGAVQIFDVAKGKWHEGENPLPTPVAEGTATAVGGKVYVVSGWQAAGKKQKISAAVQVFDPADGSWSEGQSASLPAVGASAVAVGERIYVVGGRVEGDQVTNRLAIYDPAQNLWGNGPEMVNTLDPDYVFGVYQAAAGVVDGRLLLAGGRKEAGGETLAVVQELSLSVDWMNAGEDESENAWRQTLPLPLPVAAAGGAVFGGAFHVVGGRVQTGVEEEPGALTAAVQSFEPAGGWAICDQMPTFAGSGVINGAGLTQGPTDNKIPAASILSPGGRALLLGNHLDTVTGIKVGGQAATLLGKSPSRIDFLLPDKPKVENDQAVLEVASDSERQATPVPVPVVPVAPGLYLYSFGETQEPVFLDRGPALACNDDGSLNFADQPATPGSKVVLYATGLAGADKEKLDVRVGSNNKKATVVDVSPAPAPPEGFPPDLLAGVQLLTIELPDSGLELSNNTPVIARYERNKVVSNRVVISIREKAERRDPPVGCLSGLFFVFGPLPT